MKYEAEERRGEKKHLLRRFHNIVKHHLHICVTTFVCSAGHSDQSDTRKIMIINQP